MKMLIDKTLDQNTINYTMQRLGIAATGISLGVFTIFPNIMMYDIGKPSSTLSTTIGLSASTFFVLGGIFGAIFNNPRHLLPAVGLQIGAFTIPLILTKTGLMKDTESDLDK